eukprot:Nitzschia sp. Nitz4//scaffold33_size148984//463//2508//NITZ4_002907-RA/size148984-snap-gene-0.0-mRNA-1//1//CDS//3329548364//3713//frame0
MPLTTTNNIRSPQGGVHKRFTIVAEEEPDSVPEDIIPGPKPSTTPLKHSPSSLLLDMSRRSLGNSSTRVAGSQLASRQDLDMPAGEFAEGCKLLQQAALGNQIAMEEILRARPKFVNFRDYDRRTALHVAASEGHLDICKFLVSRGARVNRSDRWGGSPLDDAHRHRHQAVIEYLRSLGASSGTTNNLTNFITAAADGDLNEVLLLLSLGDFKVDEGDYDKRTALHLAAGEGHADIVELLISKGANVNAADRWGSLPLDDAQRAKKNTCVKLLQEAGAKHGTWSNNLGDSSSRRREAANLEVAFDELDMVDRIGKGSFGEIFKCRWRGTLVAAKCIKSAKIRSEWLKAQVHEQIQGGGDVDGALKELDDAEMGEDQKKEAMADFRREISVLKSLRHPNIVLLLAYSATEDMEVMVSELMKCSLLDVFRAHSIHGTKMKMKEKIMYATHLAQGMLYLHTCRPPIIHRDLKPANLLIDQSGVLKVADFGLAKVRPDPRQLETEKFLMTGETGSYRFMAPEVYRHEHYSESVDVYSYAMILFYLLDGHPPWPTYSGLSAVRKAALEGDRPAIPRNWDVRLENILQESWHETPGSRPRFDIVLRSLNAFSRDVFRTDSEVLSPSSETASGCNCTLM